MDIKTGILRIFKSLTSERLEKINFILKKFEGLKHSGIKGNVGFYYLLDEKYPAAELTRKLGAFREDLEKAGLDKQVIEELLFLNANKQQMITLLKKVGILYLSPEENLEKQFPGSEVTVEKIKILGQWGLSGIIGETVITNEHRELKLIEILCRYWKTAGEIKKITGDRFSQVMWALSFFVEGITSAAKLEGFSRSIDDLIRDRKFFDFCEKLKIESVGDYVRNDEEMHILYRFYLDNNKYLKPCLKILNKALNLGIIKSISELKTREGENKVYRFSEQPNFKARLPLFENFNERWNIKDLIAVRADFSKFSKRLVESRLGKPKAIYAPPIRPTIHFTLNHVVESHLFGAWHKCDIVFLIPFNDLIEKSRKSFFGGPTVDIFFVGLVILPKSTEIIRRKKGETFNSFTHRVQERIAELGYKNMPGGQWNWEDSFKVKDWWDNLSAKNNWKTNAHEYTKFRNAEEPMHSPRIFATHSPTEIRLKIMENLKRLDPVLYVKYEKFLRAWNSYWSRFKEETVESIEREFLENLTKK